MGLYNLEETQSLLGAPEFDGSFNNYQVVLPELMRFNGDLSGVASLVLPELNPPPSLTGPEFDPGAIGMNPMVAFDDTWTPQIGHDFPRQRMKQYLSGDVEEEDSGIKLVHALLTCAEAIQHGELRLAVSVVKEMTNGLLPRVNMSCGFGKVASYFIEALGLRLFQPGQQIGPIGSGLEFEVLYHHFYEACPYLKFAHFTANQAIFEAFEGYDCVHVIDLNFMNGLQWPALIQALALRRGGPPSLRLTSIGPPLGNKPEYIREIGMKLAHLARSVNMKFAFRSISTSHVEDIKLSMLEINPREGLAVNAILHLHRLLGSSIDSVLKWIQTLNPKIMTLVEQEANHNQPEFLNRFIEALYYYSTMFDSLEVCQIQHYEKNLVEMYIQIEISNIISCEGLARVERHEPLAYWRVRMGMAGFKPVNLSQNSLRQASMLLTLFSSQGYDVEEREGFLTLGWHRRPLMATSTWHVGPTHAILSSSTSS